MSGEVYDSHAPTARTTPLSDVISVVVMVSDTNALHVSLLDLTKSERVKKWRKQLLPSN
jgi:hypothetical protein